MKKTIRETLKTIIDEMIMKNGYEIPYDCEIKNFVEPTTHYGYNVPVAYLREEIRGEYNEKGVSITYFLTENLEILEERILRKYTKEEFEKLLL